MTSDLKRAQALYRAFRETAPRTVKKRRVRLPRAVAHLGRCEFIGYITTHRNKPALYVHYFAPGSRPSLYANTGRGELYMFGGRFKVTGGGITDLNKRGSIVDYRPRFKVLQVDSQGRLILGPKDLTVRRSSRSRLTA